MNWKEFFKPSILSVIIFIVLVIIVAILPIKIYPCTFYSFNQNGVDYSSAVKSFCGVPFISFYVGPHIEYSSLMWIIFLFVNIVLPYILSRVIVYPFQKKK